MKFEIKKDNKVYFYTIEESCIPPLNQLKDMKQWGYIAYIDNKKMSLTKKEIKNDIKI